MGESVYATRGGPWQPIDHKYGFCFKADTAYAHLLKDQAGTAFRFPPLGDLRPKRVFDVWTSTDLPFTVDADGGVTVQNLNRDNSPADTVVGVQYDHEVVEVWKK